MEILLIYKLFLKSMFTVVGTVFTFDLMNVRGALKYMISKPEIVKDIGLPKEDHTIVVGQTRKGKTYSVIKSVNETDKGVLLFNTLHTPLNVARNQFVEGNGEDNTPEQVIELLKQGRKINFMPSTDNDIACKQLDFIIQQLYHAGEIDCYIVVDEVHLLNKQGIKACKRVSTAGLRYLYKGVFISQRAQNIDKDLLTQSNYFVSFHIKEHDQQYLQDKGVPVEEMMNKIQGQKYIFATYDEEKVKGGFKIG